VILPHPQISIDLKISIYIKVTILCGGFITICPENPFIKQKSIQT